MSAADTLAAFAGVPLATVEARAALHDRVDRKYVVPAAALAEAMERWAADYDVLDIAGTRAFAYRSVYFDGPGYPCFVQHHQGRRARFKVRTRVYEDTGACFIEVKLKGARGRTLKRRLPYEGAAPERLNRLALDHVGSAYGEVYGRPFECDLQPAMTVSYRRTTLVAKTGGSRITIDRGVAFASGGDLVAVAGGLAVVETKSSGRSPADIVLRRLHQHPVSKCSKYCVGLVALGKVGRFNNFRPALRALGVVPPAPLPDGAAAGRPAAGDPCHGGNVPPPMLLP